jgi:hypothetical protein
MMKYKPADTQTLRHCRVSSHRRSFESLPDGQDKCLSKAKKTAKTIPERSEAFFRNGGVGGRSWFGL